MYLVTTYEGEAARKAAADVPPLGPGFPWAVAVEATKMEVWGTSFGDPGPDHCEFVLFKDGREIARKKVEGY